MSRLSIDISAEEHRQIKAMAALQGKSIKELVLGRLFDDSNNDDQEWRDFLALLKERVSSAQDQEPIRSTLSEIASEYLRSKSNV